MANAKVNKVIIVWLLVLAIAVCLMGCLLRGHTYENLTGVYQWQDQEGEFPQVKELIELGQLPPEFGDSSYWVRTVRPVENEWERKGTYRIEGDTILMMDESTNESWRFQIQESNEGLIGPDGRLYKRFHPSIIPRPPIDSNTS